MERIKDFIYEKSDLFFATVVVFLVGVVILYNLNGWLVIDSEASKYHQTTTKPVESSSIVDQPTQGGQSGEKTTPPADQSTATQPTKDDKKDQEQNKSTEDKKISEQNKPKEETKPAEQPKPQEQAKPAEQPKPQEQKKPAEQQKPQEQPKQDTKKTITIASGSSAGSIAGTLKSNGLISDTNAFLNKVVASGKENKLKAGTFTIPNNASMDQIINILTN